jgi:hypothetical protein
MRKNVKLHPTCNFSPAHVFPERTTHAVITLLIILALLVTLVVTDADPSRT